MEYHAYFSSFGTTREVVLSTGLFVELYLNELPNLSNRYTLYSVTIPFVSRGADQLILMDVELCTIAWRLSGFSGTGHEREKTKSKSKVEERERELSLYRPNC